MRIGNLDTRRLIPCAWCGEIVYLTKEWKYPRHNDPEPFQGELLPCRRVGTDSGLEQFYEAAKAHESVSALQDYRDNALKTLMKMNELEIALGQQVLKTRREHG